MIEFQVFNVALGAMDREHARIRQAADRIASTNLTGADGAAFSRSIDSAADANMPTVADAGAPAQSVSTLDEMTTIMAASRLYEANVTVVSAARSAFEKALEISGRR